MVFLLSLVFLCTWSAFLFYRLPALYPAPLVIRIKSHG